MPIYEYRCESCGRGQQRLPAVLQFSADPTSCQICGGDLRRIISRVAYIRSEMDKIEQLDPRYHKMVDEAIARAPANSDPDYHMNRMVPFSSGQGEGRALLQGIGVCIPKSFASTGEGALRGCQVVPSPLTGEG